MQIDACTAVVDNDFVNHLIESKLTDDRLVAVLNIVFSEQGLSAVMHPLVYEKELLKDVARVRLLFREKIISKVGFDDIFQSDPGKRIYYIYLVKNLYRSLMGEPLPVADEDILTYWVRKKSLGEVHSMTMCLVCGCGIFLSDDADSKILKSHVDRMAIGKIEVYNRDEFINKHMAEGVTKLNRKERKSLAHSAS